MGGKFRNGEVGFWYGASGKYAFSLVCIGSMDMVKEYVGYVFSIGKNCVVT